MGHTEAETAVSKQCIHLSLSSHLLRAHQVYVAETGISDPATHDLWMSVNKCRGTDSIS